MMRGRPYAGASVSLATRNLYATGGVSVSDLAVTALREAFDRAQTGWTIGGGMEYAIADHWTGRLEYRHGRSGEIAFASANFDGNLYRIRLRDNSMRLALAYRFGLDAPEAGVK